jgi:hypothetical protein
VSLLEEMPVRETLDAVDELNAADLRPGAVFVNRVTEQRIPAASLASAASGAINAAQIRDELATVGLDLPQDTVEDLVTEAMEHAARDEASARARATLAEANLPSMDLPELTDGVDVAGLYELAEALGEQGVR